MHMNYPRMTQIAQVNSGGFKVLLAVFSSAFVCAICGQVGRWFLDFCFFCGFYWSVLICVICG